MMRTLLKASLIVFACLATLTASLAAEAELKDGVYKGAAKGYLDQIEVEVVVKDSKIASVKILKSSDDRPKKALKTIPARIVKEQKAQVDAVTGATYTSKGVCDAVQAALAKAREQSPTEANQKGRK